MKRNSLKPSQTLFLPMAQSGVESSSCINTWGDLSPAAIKCQRTTSETELPIEAPAVSVPGETAVESAIRLFRHAVFGEPLSALLSIDPRAGSHSLLPRPPLRQWRPVRGWTNAPAEHSGRYAVVYTKVALAVQAALREWMSCLYFDSLERFADIDLACGITAWRASRPATGDHVDCMAYDILDHRMMGRCFHWIERTFGGELHLLRPITRSLGPVQSEAFNPALADRILVRVKRSQRGLYSMLKAEEDIITQIIKLATMIPQLQTKGPTQRRAVSSEIERQVRRTFATIEVRLKRFAPTADFSAVPSLILTVFTETLEQSIAMIEAKFAFKISA